jgi:PAS domain S-box-containing protein
MIDTDGRIKKVNSGFLSLFDYSENEVLGKNVNSLITDEENSEEAENISQKALLGVATQLETVRVDKNKNKIPVLINTVPIRNNGSILAAYGIYVDLTNQKKLENELQQSLKEKDVLLQEVHHRVKNNLAIIAGLLELQIMHIENEFETDQLKEALSRVFSISSIHETLYQHEDVVRIRFDNYLDRIIESLPARMNKHVAEIKKNPDSEPLMLNLNQAVPLGLIINELINLGVANENIGEKISITLSSDNHTVKLEIDGINPQIDELKTGLKPDTFHKLLIKTFLDQIDARIKLEESTSNKLVIQFKKSDSMKGANSSISDQHNLVKKQIIIEN